MRFFSVGVDTDRQFAVTDGITAKYKGEGENGLQLFDGNVLRFFHDERRQVSLRVDERHPPDIFVPKGLPPHTAALVEGNVIAATRGDEWTLTENPNGDKFALVFLDTFIRAERPSAFALLESHEKSWFAKPYRSAGKTISWYGCFVLAPHDLIAIVAEDFVSVVYCEADGDVFLHKPKEGLSTFFRKNRSLRSEQ